MLPASSLNVTDVTIKRPTRTGPAGDQVGTPSTEYSGLSGYYEPASAIVRTNRGAEVQLSGLLMLDPLDADCEPIDVQVGDFVSYTDRSGRVTTDREILRIEPYYKGAEVDHLEVAF